MGVYHRTFLFSIFFSYFHLLSAKILSNMLRFFRFHTFGEKTTEKFSREGLEWPSKGAVVDPSTEPTPSSLNLYFLNYIFFCVFLQFIVEMHVIYHQKRFSTTWHQN